MRRPFFPVFGACCWGAVANPALIFTRWMLLPVFMAALWLHSWIAAVVIASIASLNLVRFLKRAENRSVSDSAEPAGGRNVVLPAVGVILAGLLDWALWSHRLIAGQFLSVAAIGYWLVVNPLSAKTPGEPEG